MPSWDQAVYAADRLHDQMLAVSTEVAQFRAGQPASTDLTDTLPQLERLADQVRDAVTGLAGEVSGVDK